MNSNLAGTLLKALNGREPSLEGLADDRARRLLRPLLSAIHEDIRTHRLPHGWPRGVSLAANWTNSDRRLNAYLAFLRRSPRDASLRAVYQDWVSTHEELAKLCRAPGRLSVEQIEQNDDKGHSRVSPLLFSTLWAVEHLKDEAGEGSSVLGILGHLDEMFATRVAELAAAADGSVADHLKKARSAGERRGERRAAKELADLRREQGLLRAKLTETESARSSLEDERRALRQTKAELTSNLGRARRELRESEGERDAAVARVQRIRDALREEQAKGSELEGRVADVSDQVRVLQLQVDELTKQLASSPSGPSGLVRLLNHEIESADLLRGTTEGKTQLSAVHRFTQLKRIREDLFAVYPELKPEDQAVPRAVHRKTSFRVTALGGGDEIGASCYMLEIAGTKMLVDCGIRIQETDISRLGPALPDMDGIQAVVLTHAHTDHIGWLGALMALGYDRDIYCTRETHDLLDPMLSDSLTQLRRLMAIQNLKAQYTHEQVAPEPYSAMDVERVFRHLRPVACDVPMPLSPEISFSFFRAGHILGASSVKVEAGGRSIFFTGDFSTFQQETVFPARWPEDGDFDLVVTESTYGGVDRGPRDDAIRDLINALRDRIAHGGTSLIPSFALGRAQEVLSMIARAMDSGDLDRVPVWIDGMTEKIDLIYQQYGQIEFPENFRHVKGEGFSREEVVDKAKQGPNIIVSTSGMLSGGPMVYYASQLARNAKNQLFFCGYLDEEQPGHKLLRLSDSTRASRRVRVRDESGDEIEIVAATPPKRFELSAHSDQSQIVAAIKPLKPAHIMLVHGDSHARQSLLRRLNEEGFSASLDIEYESTAS